MSAMRVTPPTASARSPLPPDGFTALDGFHRKTLAMLDELSSLVAKVEIDGLDPQTCARAARCRAAISRPISRCSRSTIRRSASG